MAKSIMVQGTTSNAGKSLIAAAFCRIFKQEGLKVAPFKSQNMALNSYITHEGLEMGRAQVMQAEAAGIEPSALMNPVLLKPTGDTGSQVILKGEVLGNMSAQDYYSFKETLRPSIQEAYDQLAAANDVIVLEGAGSPAEINLKQNDFVNMGMAKMASAPVIIVGDIDRGGVFASLYGTIALLDPDEQDLVKATLINKFRGDVALLEPGLDQLRDLTGKPVLGVVPYLRLDIDDEDSLSERIATTDNTGKPIDVVVIRLPHVSNFTDLNALARYPQLGVRYVERPDGGIGIAAHLHGVHPGQAPYPGHRPGAGPPRCFRLLVRSHLGGLRDPHGRDPDRGGGGPALCPAGPGHGPGTGAGWLCLGQRAGNLLPRSFRCRQFSGRLGGPALPAQGPGCGGIPHPDLC